MTEQDKYFEELEKREEQDERDAYNYGGGYEAQCGDYEGACLARGEYEAGLFS